MLNGHFLYGSTPVYPHKWKFEWVTPVPKVKDPDQIKDLRKISCTSDYSKLFERFLKKWITNDIEDKLDPGQYGNQKGTGTEHLLVSLLDRILCHLDRNVNSPVIVSYLSNCSMSVKLNGVTSEVFQMPGGGPQGTLLGVLEYLIQSNNNADCVDEDLRFKYVDDLTFLELISLALTSTGLANYNCKLHVPNDIGADHLFIPASNLKTQEDVQSIARWTRDNKMKLNEKKSNYMIISRAYSDVSTRIILNDENLERVHHVKLLGVWITDNLDWALNTRELCKKAYARITLLTKLKYAGTQIADLITIYNTFIRCLLEYCCIVWHSSLTIAQINSIERVQKISLRIILGDEYQGYEEALEACGLESS